MHSAATMQLPEILIQPRPFARDDGLNDALAADDPNGPVVDLDCIVREKIDG
jgi:hypothetical protein